MVEIVRSQTFVHWLKRLKDRRAIAKIVQRIDRLSLGNFGDVKSVGGGVSELRVDHGPGYRLYFARRQNGEIVILLCGGTKKRQNADIAGAQEMARNNEIY
ncbi:type II toxin-antitoxin system RelE/ParE family toxin [Sphingorhabdus sp. SMR4y]|uniref:type II toxin-antitoxin system RelE/ParE family toxin n=1 Tax=Sphingorhabdus sp. SMR4y TaxID=2584094 RepID=UPI000B5C89AC|nr:type II toxin-antitoxin system RelE/ParE family toxin [Sphingorhabdus sp. SMR4y]ASK87981.1 addiction module antitoxin RelB [Sphingorhabdus sp. SMR4y]